MVTQQLHKMAAKVTGKERNMATTETCRISKGLSIAQQDSELTPGLRGKQTRQQKEANESQIQ